MAEALVIVKTSVAGILMVLYGQCVLRILNGCESLVMWFGALMWADHPSLLIALCDFNSIHLLKSWTLLEKIILLIYLLLLFYWAYDELLYPIIHLLSVLLINIVIDVIPSVKLEDASFQADRA